jgi:hypothetical protein
MTEIPHNGKDDDCNPATKDDPDPPTIPLGLKQAGAVALLLHLDEGGGGVTTSADDLKLKGTLGAATGGDAKDPLWQTGRFGKALLFDGVNDFVRFPFSTALDMKGSFTVEAWIARRLPSTGEDTVLVKGTPGRRNYRLYLAADGKVGFLWENGSKTHPNAPTLGKTPIPGNDTAWHHLACVFDAVLGENRIYIDGQLDNTGATAGLPVTNKDPLYLGAATTTGVEAFSGLVDEIRVSSMVRYKGNFVPPAAPFAWPSAVHLRWSPNGETDLAGYNVYRSYKTGGPYTRLNGALLSEPAYDDTATNPLLPRLFYVVTAVDTSDNESASSEEIRGKAPPSLH